MSGKGRDVGAVVQIALPNGEYAYGRVLRDAAVAFYRDRSRQAGQPPIGSRDFQFVVGVHDDTLSLWPTVGRDPSRTSDEDWPPPASVTDPITKRPKYIYERGEMRPLKPGEDVFGLEPAAVWGQRDIVARLLSQSKAN